MSGIAEVARLAGVSKSTASRALTGGGYVSDETRRRVQDAAGSLGYVPTTSAVSLATGRTNTVALIVPRVKRWYFGSIIEGVERTLIPRGYDLTLYVAEPDSRDRVSLYSHFLARKRFDGVIAVALEPDDDDIQRLLAFGKPTVCIGNELTDIATLGIDNTAIGRMITQHLLALGHRSIAFLGETPADEPAAHDVSDRIAGYRQAMRGAGLDAAARSHDASLTITDGYAAAAALLADVEGRPTAIVAACDEIAIGTIIAARRLGITVPGQLSVVGIDGHDYAEMFALTTVEQHPAAQGEQAVDILLGMVDYAAAPARSTIPVQLVVRASTAPPR
ncbi:MULTISPECIES: LacI family DNA-binding transcriptional regulator [unclassified Microbacterium]|uniref:LacI family DNA-binding transcriptional regulator n=1 Tax=unclassified Microbacterium TaxID=2609290 RepID=UPI003744C24E